MKKKLLFPLAFFTFLLFAFAATVTAQTIHYVKVGGATDKSGTSWGTASDDLQAMINQSAAGEMIFVALGTYQPADGQSFAMKDGVKIYGGFNGNENNLNERDLSGGHNSILKGSGKEVIDNRQNGLTNAAVLDGFVITGGKVNGGMFNNGSSPVLNNLIFFENTSDPDGGGMENHNSSPILTNILFVNNKSINGHGGGMGISNTSAPTIINVSFVNNEAGGVGRGIYKEWGSGAQITNAVFFGNTSHNGGNDIYYDGSNPSLITYSYLQSGFSGTGNIQNASDPFVNSSNPMGVDGLWGTDDDGLKLKSGSPAINTGDNSAINATGITTDISGKTRIQETVVDMGAYEGAESTTISPANGRLYVKKTNASRTNSSNLVSIGNSWNNALSDLADAMKAAVDLNTTTPGSVTEIWVAGGSYLPKYRADNMNGDNPNDISNAFVLIKDVKIYGGFAGNEETLTERDLKLVANASILSGDLGEIGVTNNNSFHVVVSNGDIGTAELNGFTIRDGNAFNGNGGGIFISSSSPVLSNLIITENQAKTQGGGIFMVSSSPSLRNVAITNNTSYYFGGGIYNDKSSPVLTNVTISGNYAGSYGGGIYNTGSSPTLTNVAITGNQAIIFGGGIYNTSNTFGSIYSSPVLTNVTISGNAAVSSGGVAHEGGAIYNNEAGDEPQIRNSIIYNNNTAMFGGNPTIAFSLIQGLSNTNNGNIDGNTDPLFVNGLTPGRNLGGDYRLQAASPAINAGSNSYFAEGLTPDLHLDTTDIDGNPRILKGTADMGAFEKANQYNPDVHHILYVQKGKSGNGSSWGTNAIGELADALQAASELNAETPGTVTQIWVSGGSYKPSYQVSTGTTDPRDVAFVLVKDVKVYGGFAGTENLLTDRNLSISGNTSTLNADLLDGNRTNDDAYHAVISAGDIGTAELNGFRIKGGNADGTGSIQVNLQDVLRTNGGGVCVLSSSPILTNLIINNNNGFNGAGIYNNTSSSIMTNVIISSNNAANQGGGMYNENSTPILTNVVMSNNNALNAGAIYNMANSKPEIRNTIIYGNYSGIVNDNSTSDIAYSLVQGLPANTSNHNLDGNGSIDPLFVNASGGNYHLQVTSPLINKGSNTYFEPGANPNISSIVTDLEGNARIQKGVTDMGAYESSYVPAMVADDNGIIYVKTVAAGSGNGSSWDNATSDLQAAINTVGVEQVWVAGGIYLPLYMAGDGTSDRDKAFVLAKNVRIFGGFKGDETDFSQRDLTLTNYTTTLSGDLKTLNDNSDNAYHVVISAGDVGYAELNGFTIKDGNANYFVGITVNLLHISSDYGGGIYNNSSSAIFNNILIKDNYSVDGGGGIYNYNSSSLILTNIFINANSSNYGGGIFNQSSTPILTNATISGNSASHSGSEWYNQSGTPVIRNSIIYGNSVAGYLFDTENSLIQNQDGNDNYADVNNHNLPTDTDPLFVNSGNGNYHLQPLSPAIDAGKNSFFNFLENGDKDLAGNSRIQGNTIDMGAFENPISYNQTDGILYVKKNTGTNKQNVIENNLVTPYGGGWDNAIPEFADALKAAALLNATTPGTVTQIWVAEGTYFPYYRPDDMSVAGDNSSEPAFVLLKDVKIYGSFEGVENSLSERTAAVIAAHPSKLSGKIDPSYSAFHVVISAGDVGDAELNGFIISDGLADGDFHNTISVNSEEVAQSYGGGIYLINSSPSIVNVTLKNNTALSGGGIYAYRSKASITNSTISGNSTPGGSGGGISIIDDDNSVPSLIMTNVVISGNTSGGGIYNEISSPILTNVTIAGNTEEGIGNYRSKVQIRNSIIYDNGNGVTNYDQNGVVPVITYSLVQGSSNTDNGNIDGSTDPLFEDAPGGDYHLQASSPVINQGNNAYFAFGGNPDLFAITSDRDGKKRKKNTIDFGAYEYGAFVLPVNLLSYTAEAQGNIAKLKWTTASETNNKEFIVSRSVYGKTFTEIGKVTGSLNSNTSKDYVFYDTHPENGINYYRLEQIDMDGRITDLGIRTVQFAFANDLTKLYPNPTRDMLKIEFGAGKYQSLALMDNNGKVLQRISVSIIENQKILNLSNQASGVYFVRLIGENSVVKKVVKE